MRHYQEVLEQREKELEKRRGEYQSAKAMTVSPVNINEIASLYQLLRSYIPGDQSEKAVYIVAQATMVVEKIYKPFSIVEEYERKKKTIEQMREQVSTG